MAGRCDDCVAGDYGFIAGGDVHGHFHDAVSADGTGAACQRRDGDGRRVVHDRQCRDSDGHSGLGKNIRALARTTGAQRGKYQLAYLYACQTLGYLDPAMFERRAALNEGDPDGTKYLDVIANTLVAYGDQGQAFLDLYKVVLDQAAPKTFNQILRSASSSHIPIVYGEHDNTFRR